MKPTATDILKAIIALLACPLMCACQSDDVPTEPELPVGTPHSVQLGYSISSGKPSTRMSDKEVGFGLETSEQGLLSHITFIPYAVNGTIGDDANPIGEHIEFDYNNGKNNLYNNAQIPLGTRSFLVYAQHSYTNEGRLDLKLDHPAKNIRISPVSFLAAGTQEYTDFKAKGQLLLDYITKIANTTYNDNGTPKSWSQTSDTDMLRLYKEFISLKPGGDINDDDPPFLAVASSSLNVIAMVEDFYEQLADKDDALSTAIKNNITTHNGVNLLDSKGKISFSVLNSPLPDNFPTYAKLPSGSAACKWNKATNKFEDQAITVSSLRIAPTECYTYPAALWYRTNSTILTSVESKQQYYGLGGVAEDGSNIAPNPNLDWNNDIISNYTQSDGLVSTKTKSVAVKSQLQYAVAQFSIKLNAVSNELIDNSGSVVNISDQTTFPLTGVLVGGQRAVDYSFQQFENSSPSFSVYDCNVTGWSLYKYTTQPEKPVRTLLLESHPAYKVDDKFVPITFALEFLNNSGADFIGVDGKIIASGCRFYLIGDILPTDTGGGTLSFGVGDRVFEQDRITHIDVMVNSLKNAYYIIPDLRDPQLKVGLTVTDWIMSTPSGTQDTPMEL